MLFEVTKTSLIASNDISPCNEAIKIKLGAVETWGIEFNSLKEVIEFAYKYDEVILGKSWINKQTPHLEIYDDYRE